MFNSKVYIKRREILKKKIKSGLVLFLGNDESPMNYAANLYPFRQDSTFLYYWGIDLPGLAAVMDIDSGSEILFGNDYTLDDIVWMGPQPTLKELAAKTGVKKILPFNKLEEELKKKLMLNRRVHFLPQYREKNILRLSELLGLNYRAVKDYVSIKLIGAVVAQRSVKSSEEIKEIEKALAISCEMHTVAMKMTKPGITEREVGAAVDGIALKMGSGISFPVIFSVHGETLHNHYSNRIMKSGQLALHDSGAETDLHYASDITRTFPVNGKFSTRQKEIYDVVLNAQLAAIKSIKAGIKFKSVHIKTSRVIAEGLKSLGLMKGDTAEAVNKGAHALFFPHGLGHMLGLDVHDLESLGEQFVGYDKKIQRSSQFGLAYLRLAKELKPGFVLTVEPGIYFIPQLINTWKAEKKFAHFINYNTVEKYKDFGGIRIEDNVLVEKEYARVLGKPIPKTINEVEGICQSK